MSTAIAGHRSSSPLSACRPGELVRVYVWEWPVRLTHWLIVYSILAPGLTGLYMGHPFLIVASGPGGPALRDGLGEDDPLLQRPSSSRLSVRSRAWSGCSWATRYARWDKFVPVAPTPLARALGTPPVLPLPAAPASRIRRPQPARRAHLPVRVPAVLHDDRDGAGSLQRERPRRLAVPRLPFLLPLFGGAQTARWIHHVGMWLILGFRRPPRLQRGADVAGGGSRHGGVHGLGLQVRALRGPRLLRLSLRRPEGCSPG